MIAAAFFPKPVIVRLSDFKTNEYASLLGGRWFEPQEANPMIGFRGASRYTHPAYAEGFALECRAMQRVRQEMGLTNVKLMIPFCRRVKEAEDVLQAMAGHGLERGKDGLEIYVMCEIPNNVIQIDAFARLFDGFSIGSNDLTQLDARGRPRFRDRRLRLRRARPGRHGNDPPARSRAASATGAMSASAARRRPIIRKWPSYLVEQGIDSISLNPDSLIRTIRNLVEVERRLGIAPRAGAAA